MVATTGLGLTTRSLMMALGLAMALRALLVARTATEKAIAEQEARAILEMAAQWFPVTRR